MLFVLQLDRVADVGKFPGRKSINDDTSLLLLNFEKGFGIFQNLLSIIILHLLL